MNKGKKVLTSKCMLNKSIEASLYDVFKIKWIENKKDKEGNKSKEELKKIGCEMSHIDQVESCANRDLINHNIDHRVSNGIMEIFNSCDGEVHPVTRCCNRTILTQSIVILISNAIKIIIAI